jgi:hypothetical protein
MPVDAGKQKGAPGRKAEHAFTSRMEILNGRILAENVAQGRSIWLPSSGAGWINREAMPSSDYFR